jgi:Flp pilus assembly pilin Flp
MIRSINTLWQDEEAVTTVEYALLLGTIVLASITAWTRLGEEVRNAVTQAATTIEEASVATR